MTEPISTPRAAGVIASRILTQRLRDRSAIIFGLIVPLGLAVIFSLLLPSFDGGSLGVQVAVVDQDGGGLGTALAAVFDAVDDQVVARIEVDDVDAGEVMVTDGLLDAVVVIPPGFTIAATSGASPDLLVIAGPDRLIAREVVVGITRSFTAEVDRIDAMVLTALRADPTLDARGPGVIEGLVARARTTATTSEITSVGASDRTLDSTTYLAAGMAVFFLFFTASFGVIGLIAERQEGTLPRLLVAPIERSAVTAGAALASFVLGLVSMTVLVAATTVLLGATWGPPLGVALLVVSAIMSATGIMWIVAATARTQEQATALASIISIVLGMLGGAFFPLSTDNRIVATLANLSPARWFLRGLGDLAGGGVSAAMPAVGALLAFGIVSFVGARLIGVELST